MLRYRIVSYLSAQFATSRSDPVALTSRTLNWGPLSFGFLAAIAEFQFAQSRELYLRLAGDAELAQALLGLLGVVLFACVLHAWNSLLLGRRIDQLYPDHARVDVDQRLKQVRNLNGLLCASLPLTGLVLGLLWVWNDIGVTRQQIGWSDATLTGHLEMVSNRILLFVGITVASSILLLLFLRRHAGTSSLWVTWLVGLGVLFVPLLPNEVSILLSRQLGPLCSFALVAIGVIALIRLLTNGMRWFVSAVLVRVILWIVRWLGGGTSFVALVGTGAVMLTAALILGLLRPGPAAHIPQLGRATIASNLEARRSTDANRGLQSADTFRRSFERWLDARDLRGANLPSPDKPYPIFVVAAQGGGIYAASLALTFLSSIQDQCPAFARHVFAISAVSGGAIGASIFQNMAVDRGGHGCARSVTSGVHSSVADRVATDDHLSALLLATPLDWLSKLVPGDSTYRADAVRDSFLYSYRRRNQISGDDLAAPFIKHWRPDNGGREPALILNATSVETGERVAFAPFPLVEMGKSTLTSFIDLETALELEPAYAETLRRQSVIDAAVTSARFPGILPAWPLRHSGLKNERGEVRQLNFVDGGYADSSGAATAADVLAELQSALEDLNIASRFSLTLILLTDTDATIDLSRAQGNNFIDTLAPLTALLNVRQLLARRAVAQAVADLKKRNIDVITLKLDHRIFPLPLGWTLSRTSNLLIERMVANPVPCFSREPDPDNPEARPRLPTSFEELVRTNNCERARIIDLLSR